MRLCLPTCAAWGGVFVSSCTRMSLRQISLLTLHPTKITWLKLSGMRIPPLKIKIMLESNPLKSMLWGRLAVLSACVQHTKLSLLLLSLSSLSSLLSLLLLVVLVLVLVYCRVRVDGYRSVVPVFRDKKRGVVSVFLAFNGHLLKYYSLPKIRRQRFKLCLPQEQNNFRSCCPQGFRAISARILTTTPKENNFGRNFGSCVSYGLGFVFEQLAT